MTLRSLTLWLLVALSGCMSPDRKAAKAVARVDAARDAEAANRLRQTAAAAVLIHGTGYALARETNASLAVQTASDLSRRASLTLELPKYADGLAIERIVDGLLSDNLDLRRKAAADLAGRDGVIAGLQSELDRLHGKTVKAETRRDDVFFTVAGEAATWRRIKLGLWLLGGVMVLLVVGPVLLGALGTAFPAIGPVVGIVGNLIGGVAKRTFTAMPQAAAAAGVVAADALDRSQAALAHVVAAVERQKGRPEVWSALKADLRDVTDSRTRAAIAAVQPSL